MRKNVYPSSIHPDIFFQISRVFSVYAGTSLVFQNAQLKGDIHFGDERGSFFCSKIWKAPCGNDQYSRLKCEQYRKELIQKAKKDKKVIVEQCYAGLIEIIAPVYFPPQNFQGVISTWQILPEQINESHLTQLKKLSKSLSVDYNTLSSLYLSCLQADKKFLSFLVNLLHFFAQYLQEQKTQSEIKIRKYKRTHPRKFPKISFEEMKRLFFTSIKKGNRRKIPYLSYQTINWTLTPYLVVKKFRTIQFLSCFLCQDLKALLKDYQPDFEKIFVEHINTIIFSDNEKQLSDSLARIFTYYFDLYQKAYPPFHQNNIEEIKNFIKDNFYQPLSVSKLCQKFHYNRPYFSIMFKKEAGITYRDYLKKIRIEKAKELMKKTSLTISEIAFEVGYRNFNVFWEAFKSREKISPREWRKKL